MAHSTKLQPQKQFLTNKVPLLSQLCTSPHITRSVDVSELWSYILGGAGSWVNMVTLYSYSLLFTFDENKGALFTQDNIIGKRRET